MDHLKSDSAVSAAGVDCANDPIKSLVTMFVDMVQAGRIAKGQCPALRPVFLKPHGVAAAQFHIRADLPAELRVGLFAEPGRTYPAWVRFSSDTTPTRVSIDMCWCQKCRSSASCRNGTLSGSWTIDISTP